MSKGFRHFGVRTVKFSNFPMLSLSCIGFFPIFYSSDFLPAMFITSTNPVNHQDEIFFEYDDDQNKMAAYNGIDGYQGKEKFQMQSEELHYFSAANTARGFQSFYDETFRDIQHLVILKGGP